MTNAILKRLATKGFISMRKVNARNIHYLVTADGIGGRGKSPPRSVPAAAATHRGRAPQPARQPPKPAARRGPGPADPALLPLRRAGPRGLRYPLAQPRSEAARLFRP